MKNNRRLVLAFAFSLFILVCISLPSMGIKLETMWISKKSLAEKG